MSEIRADEGGHAFGPDRRSFLRTVAGGTAAVALASMIPAGCAADYPHAVTDGAKPEAFSEKEYAVTRAAAEAFLVGVPVAPGLVAQRIDAELAQIGEPVLSDFKTVLTVLEHLTLLGGRLKRFTVLDPASRLKYLEQWKRSRFALRRAVFQAIRSAVFFYSYFDDATRPLTGFEGPWPEWFPVNAYPVDFGEIV